MKKLVSLLTVVGTVLVLTACGGDRMTGETTTICNATSSVIMPNTSDVTVTIIGYDEEIITWTERITTTLADYGQIFWGVALDEDTVREIFAEVEAMGVLEDGLSWSLVSISGETLVFDVTFHYERMSTELLDEFWDGNSERHATVTNAIRGLEERNATCRTN